VNLRTAIATSACALTVLASGAACGSPAPQARAAHPSATAAPAPTPPAGAVAAYLKWLRDSVSTQSDDLLLAPGQTSDSKLIAAGMDACGDIRHEKADVAINRLAAKGWSEYDADEIVLSAAGTHLCGYPAGVTPSPAPSTPSTTVGKYLMMLRTSSKGTAFGAPILAASDARLVEVGRRICAELGDHVTPAQVEKELDQSWSRPAALVLMITAGGGTWSLCSAQRDAVQSYVHSVTG
jgi:hypothetical protein